MLTPTGLSVTPRRPAYDGLGNVTGWTDLAVIDNAVFALNTQTAITGVDTGYTQTGSLFVPRGTDLRNGDQIPYQGRNWVVVGAALWDQDNPLDGQDFGYVEYSIAWGG